MVPTERDVGCLGDRNEDTALFRTAFTKRRPNRQFTWAADVIAFT